MEILYTQRKTHTTIVRVVASLTQHTTRLLPSSSKCRSCFCRQTERKRLRGRKGDGKVNNTKREERKSIGGGKRTKKKGKGGEIDKRKANKEGKKATLVGQ